MGYNQITEEDVTKLQQVNGTMELISELASYAKGKSVMAESVSDTLWLLQDQLHVVLDGVKKREDEELRQKDPELHARLAQVRQQ